MRESMHRAAARRDDRLARIRKLSLWITGGAAAASLGLGTAFAHAMPGHASTSSASTGGTATNQSAGSSPARATTVPSHSASAAAPRSSSSNRASSSGSHKSTSHKSAKLAKPASKPAPTQAPPVVVSGGS